MRLEVVLPDSFMVGFATPWAVDHLCHCHYTPSLAPTYVPQQHSWSAHSQLGRMQLHPLGGVEGCNCLALTHSALILLISSFLADRRTLAAKVFFFLMIRPPRKSTLFPTRPLFR